MKQIEQNIHESFIQRGWTLSLAESCTGGALAACLTRLPGCSQYFLGSIVSYSNDVKVNILGVDPAVLESKGAVSSEVVSQMAEGVRRLTGSDYSLAVSGIAGPTGGSPEKPLGTVWAAISWKEGLHVWSFHLSGPREEIIQKSVTQVLDQLFSFINDC